MKICSKCNVEKDLSHFYENKAYKGGYNSRCKECMGKYRKIFYDKNPNYNDNYYKNNTKKCQLNALNYYENNKESVKQNQKENRSKIADYQRNYRRNNIQAKLANNLRCRLWLAIKQNWKAGSAVDDLGCSLEELKQYLEQQFIEGMTWENHGIKEGQWSIDHIYPLSKVDLTNREEFLKVCHFTNLRPMWHIDNIKKNAKIL